MLNSKPPLHPSKRLRVENAQGPSRHSPAADRAASHDQGRAGADAQGCLRDGSAMDRATPDEQRRAVAGAQGPFRHSPALDKAASDETARAISGDEGSFRHSSALDRAALDDLLNGVAGAQHSSQQGPVPNSSSPHAAVRAVANANDTAHASDLDIIAAHETDSKAVIASDEAVLKAFNSAAPDASVRAVQDASGKVVSGGLRGSHVPSASDPAVLPTAWAKHQSATADGRDVAALPNSAWPDTQQPSCDTSKEQGLIGYANKLSPAGINPRELSRSQASSSNPPAESCCADAQRLQAGELQYSRCQLGKLV